MVLLNINIIEGQSADVNDNNEDKLNPVNKLYNVMFKLFDDEFNISKIVEEEFNFIENESNINAIKEKVLNLTSQFPVYATNKKAVA